MFESIDFAGWPWWAIATILLALNLIKPTKELLAGMFPQLFGFLTKQAEAERERRAKVINALGEFQASAKLAAAAEVIEQFPVAMQLRFLQTVTEVAVENNSTTLFPIPIDFLKAFGGKSGGASPPGGQQ